MRCKQKQQLYIPVRNDNAANVLISHILVSNSGEIDYMISRPYKY